MGAYSRIGAYYREVVVVIELGAYIHGVLTFNGCLLSRFYGTYLTYNLSAYMILTQTRLLICTDCYHL